MWQDELLWAAAWLFRATRDPQYLQYCVANGALLGGSVNSLIQFDWDNKYVGVQMLMAKVSIPHPPFRRLPSPSRPA